MLLESIRLFDMNFHWVSSFWLSLVWLMDTRILTLDYVTVKRLDDISVSQCRLSLQAYLSSVYRASVLYKIYCKAKYFYNYG